ncbi:MAG: hypothetical protein EOO12_03135 [Chitinophagaceae bacterium]|nr:MAG: hypothetical protein EOO12_03135 [Chitinophagaceae bacterium]
MKRLLVPILMLLVLLQSFGKWIILAEFRLNRDYIAQNLCENRQRPQLKCNGRCQLMKQWAAEDKAAADAGPKLKLQEIPLLSTTVLPEPTVQFLSTARNGRYARCCADFPPNTILRPPARA